MNLKKPRNHYNVKFLKGYGISVNLKNNKVVLKNGYDFFTKQQNQEEWFVKNMPYEKIVLSGKGYVSIESLSLLNQNNRNLVVTDTFGKPITFMNSMMDSLTGTKYRIAQYDTFRDNTKKEYLTKQIISAKKQSQLRLLKMIGSKVESLPEKESSASRVYFREFAKNIPQKYCFESRNQSFIRTSKNNATDVINALLNYGYAVLAGEISKFVCGLGMDPYYGFMHKTHTGFQPLVYDVVEPFRWLVEYSVLKLANTQSKQKIRLKDYTYTKDGTVVMDYPLIKRFLEILERNFKKEQPHPFKHGRKNSDGLSMCQEITIAKLTVQNLADYCCGNSKSFLEEKI